MLVTLCRSLAVHSSAAWLLAVIRSLQAIETWHTQGSNTRNFIVQSSQHATQCFICDVASKLTAPIHLRHLSNKHPITSTRQEAKEKRETEKPALLIARSKENPNERKQKNERMVNLPLPYIEKPGHLCDVVALPHHRQARQRQTSTKRQSSACNIPLLFFSLLCCFWMLGGE